MTAEKFCLRWNDFETNISSAFKEIRDDKDLFDCTLSCGARQLQAHKLILSACSPFFKTVFKQNPHNHPLLYLKDIQFDHLQSVLNFMYHGEVNVAQEDLNNFLAVAEELKIKGLTQNGSEENSKRAKEESKPKSNTQDYTAPLPRPPPMKMARPPPAPVPAPAIVEDDEIQEIDMEVKTEPGSMSGSIGVVQEYGEGQSGTVENVEYDESYDYGYAGADAYAGQELEQDKDPSNHVIQFTDNSVYPSVEKFQCQDCGKVFSDRSNCRRHVKEFHFGEGQVSCQNCGKNFKNKRYAQAHYLNCIK